MCNTVNVSALNKGLNAFFLLNICDGLHVRHLLLLQPHPAQRHPVTTVSHLHGYFFFRLYGNTARQWGKPTVCLYNETMHHTRSQPERRHACISVHRWFTGINRSLSRAHHQSRPYIVSTRATGHLQGATASQGFSVRFCLINLDQPLNTWSPTLIRPNTVTGKP